MVKLFDLNGYIWLAIGIFIAALFIGPSASRGQAPMDENVPNSAPEVAVSPGATDQAIEERLERILAASGWFRGADVEVSEGIVTIDGATDEDEHRDWAGNLARTIEDVVAVINRIDVTPRLEWDFEPAFREIERIIYQLQRLLPVLVLVALVALFTWGAARLVASTARLALRRRIGSPLLLNLFARAVAIPVVILGTYLVLQFSGMTRLALTVLGGTGLFGLVLGFAFRDIAENFLASILLSLRNPFRMGDLVRIGEHEGIVRNLNTRSTLLATLDGNHVQIPNATVYKTVITNYSSGSSRRSDFIVGIGYDDDTSKAQSAISAVLYAHPAVKEEPQPLVLVDQLAASTVNLRVYFWFDSNTHSPIKLRSALMRHVKAALLEHGISMPDEAREVIFPKGVPIRQLDTVGNSAGSADRSPPPAPSTSAQDASAAEGGLDNEDVVRDTNATLAPEAEENLLSSTEAKTARAGHQTDPRSGA